MSNAISNEVEFDPDIANQLLAYLRDSGLCEKRSCLHLAAALAALLPNQADAHNLVDIVYAMGERFDAEAEVH